MIFITSYLFSAIRQRFFRSQVQFDYQGFACLGRYDDDSGHYIASICHPDFAAVLWAESLHHLEATFCELVDNHLQASH